MPKTIKELEAEVARTKALAEDSPNWPESAREADAILDAYTAAEQALEQAKQG